MIDEGDLIADFELPVRSGGAFAPLLCTSSVLIRLPAIMGCNSVNGTPEHINEEVRDRVVGCQLTAQLVEVPLSVFNACIDGTLQ